MLTSILLLLSHSAQDTVVASYRVEIPRIEATVQVDGRLDEPVWRQAAILDRFHQYQPVDSRPAEERTEIRVWYAPNAIYFGITAWDRQAGSLRATVADRDNLDTDDRITIYLDTFNDKRRAFFFTVNPLGVQEDGVRSEGGFTAGSLQGGTTDKSPDYLWQSHGQVTDSGYVVEVRIPFKSLRYPGDGAQTWGLNVARITQRTGYQDTWTDTRRANASFLLQSGSVTGLHHLERGITTEVQPFVTAQANGERTPAGAFRREDVQPSAGANLRLGLASNLSLDATYNPDFSQIESDASLVTVNERFALFFPEKRPFFLEGIELFATPNQLVYTRRIVDPIAGGKVTAKFGRYNVAALNAGDEAGPDAFFSITRVRRDIGANSTAGVTLTSRGQTGGYNRVLAGDARVVFGKLYYVAGQLGGSWTRAAGGGALRQSPLWEAEFDRTGRSWGFNYKLTGIGEDFEAQSGFVPRNDIVTARAFNRLSFYGSRGALIEQLSMFAGPTRIWRYEDFVTDALEGGESLDMQLTMRGGWRPALHVEHDFTDLRAEDYATYTVDRGAGPQPYRPLKGVSDGFTTSISLTTPTWQSANASARLARNRGVIFPEGSAGYETRLTGSLSLRPTSSVRIAASQTYSHITRDRDGSEFARTIIPRLKLEYQPNRSLFFRVVGEYVSERRAALLDARTGDPLSVGGAPRSASESDRLRVDALASFEPTPGTVAFFGYGASLDDNNAFGFSRMRRASDGFFLKLAYQIRR